MALSLADELAGAFGGTGGDDDFAGGNGNGGSMSLAEEFGLDMTLEEDQVEGEHGHGHEYGYDQHEICMDHDFEEDEYGLDGDAIVAGRNGRTDEASTPPLELRRLPTTSTTTPTTTVTARRGARTETTRAAAKKSLSSRQVLQPELDDTLQLQLKHQFSPRGHSFGRPQHRQQDSRRQYDSEEDDPRQGSHHGHDDTPKHHQEGRYDLVPDLEEDELSPLPSPLKLRNIRSKASIKSLSNYNVRVSASTSNLRGRPSVSELRYSQNSLSRHGFDLHMDHQNQRQEALIVLSETLGSTSRLITSLRNLDNPMNTVAGTRIIGADTAASDANHRVQHDERSVPDQSRSRSGSGSGSEAMTVEMRLQRHLDKMADCERKRDEMIRELSQMADEAALKLGFSMGTGIPSSSLSSFDMNGHSDLNGSMHGVREGLDSLPEGDEAEEGCDVDMAGAEDGESISPGWTGEPTTAEKEGPSIYQSADKEESDPATAGGKEHPTLLGTHDDIPEAMAHRSGLRGTRRYGYDDSKSNDDDDDEDDNDFSRDNPYDDYDRYDNDKRANRYDHENNETRTGHREVEHIDPHDALMLDEDEDEKESQDIRHDGIGSPTLSMITPSATTILSGNIRPATDPSYHGSTRGLTAQTTNPATDLGPGPGLGPILPHLSSALRSDSTSLMTILRNLSETLHTGSSLNTSIARQLKGIKSSLDSARAREEAERAARAGIEEWDAAKIRDGLTGDSVQNRLGRELDDFAGKVEEWGKRLEGFRVDRRREERTWIRT
ncbi:hypothetical protein IAU59_001998 [Kwoniella sp. CBS 9459]